MPCSCADMLNFWKSRKAKRNMIKLFVAWPFTEIMMAEHVTFSSRREMETWVLSEEGQTFAKGPTQAAYLAGHLYNHIAPILLY